MWTTGYRYHFDNNFPMISGFFQVRNATGDESLPQQALIIHRNTFDYNFNSAMNPVLHLGNAWIALNTGIAVHVAARQLGAAIREPEPVPAVRCMPTAVPSGTGCRSTPACITKSGPFTATGYKQDSNDVGTTLQFTVGRPWGKTALITGYTRRNLTFSPVTRQFFTTSTYGGLQRKFFQQKLTASVLAEYIRAFRVQDIQWATANILRPVATVQWNVNPSWRVDGQFAYEHGASFQDYDNMYSSFLISYVRPIHRSFNDDAGEFKVIYPLRFSVGVQAEQFPSFAGTAKSGTLFHPVFRLSIF